MGPLTSLQALYNFMPQPILLKNMGYTHFKDGLLPELPTGFQRKVWLFFVMLCLLTVFMVAPCMLASIL